MSKILGVLAGEGPANDHLFRLAQRADLIVAADAGQEVCLAHNIRPHIVVGDFDSLTQRIPGVEYRQDVDEYRSDLDKLLDLASARKPSECILAGFEGSRLDHMLAGLASIAVSSLSPRIALASGSGWLLRRGDFSLTHLKAGRTASLLPIGQCVVTMSGFQWPLARVTLDSAGAVSLSNQVVDRAHVQIHSGCALLVLNGELIDWTD